MKTSACSRWTVRLSVVALVVSLCTGRAEPQDPNLRPRYAQLSLKAGFLPDPLAQKVEAGGPIVTKLGGVTAHVSKEPDVSIIFEAGGAPLTIYVESAADTTLLINTPDEKWVADDDSGGMLNPLVKFAKPKSGRYDVWVGTIGDKVAPAVLKITELK